MFVLINPKFKLPKGRTARMDPEQFDEDMGADYVYGSKGVTVDNKGAGAATTTGLTVTGAILALVVLIGGKTKGGNLKGGKKKKGGEKKKKTGEKSPELSKDEKGEMEASKEVSGGKKTSLRGGTRAGGRATARSNKKSVLSCLNLDFLLFF